MFKKKSFLPFTLLLVTVLAEADSTTVATNYGWTPESGRVLLSGTASNIGIFGGDGMLPIYGNKDGFVYGDFMGDYGTDDTYLVSPGGGFRQVVGNQMIGAYFFGDYEKTSLGTNFWNLSPGIEWMSTHWDAHANGYFPTSTSKQSGPGQYASDFGDTSNVYFEEGTNNQYDEQVTPYTVIGNGVDAELGYSFAGKDNLRSRVYLGGYYYAPPSSDNVENITGVTAGFEQPISENIAFAIRNSYDQVSLYTVGVSLTVTFGGESNTFSNNVRDRFLDPVQRHVGIIGTGAGTYDQQYLQNEGVGLQYDNVYFVSDDGTGNGTYGSSAPLTQDTLNMIDAESPDDSRIYVQGGTDATYYVNSETTSTSEGGYGYPGDQGLVLYSGQNIFGRSEDFTASASEAEQPTIIVDTADGYNGFIIPDVNGATNTISDITLVGNSDEFGSGIVVYGSEENDITLNVNNTHISGFSTGISAENDGAGILTLDVESSTFLNNQQAGIYARNVGNTGTMMVNIADSQLDENTEGLDVQNISSNGTLMVNATNTTFNNNSDFGIHALNYGGTGSVLSVNVAQSQLNENAASGIYLQDIGGTLKTTAFSATDSQINNNGNDGIFAIGEGSSHNVFTLDLINSSLNENGLRGIEASAGAGEETFTINATNTTLDNNVQNGILIYNQGSTLTINATNSTFNNNGQTGLLVDNIAGDSSSSTTLNISGSSFDNNGNDGLTAERDSGDATLTVNVTDSTFDNNGGNGLSLYSFSGSSAVTLNADSSSFSNNLVNGLFVYNVSDADMAVVATNSLFDGNQYGFQVNNSSTGTLMVTDLSGSSFNNNTYYGIVGAASLPDLTTINYSNTTFSGDSQTATNDATSTNVGWIN